MSGKFVGQIEREKANPSVRVVGRLAAALGLEAWELLSDDGGPSGPAWPPAWESEARVAAERVVRYVSGRPRPQLDRALRILEAALEDVRPVR